MATQACSQRLDRIAKVLGISRDGLLGPLPSDALPQTTVMDGAADQFDLWVDRAVDPDQKARLSAIAVILNDARTRQGRP